MAIVIDGKSISEKILKTLAKKIKKNQLRLKLAVVLVGNDSVSKIFVKEKEKACQKVGIDFLFFQFSPKISQKEIEKKIEEISKRSDIKGIVVQLPLPKTLNREKILDKIPLEKDVDVLTSLGTGKFYNNSLSIIPPVVKSVETIFKNYRLSLKNKNIVLIGAGHLVGAPLALWLLKKKASFTLIEKFNKDISFYTKKADIIISGIGKENFITKKMVKKGVVVIDIGNCYKKNKIKGDVDFENVKKVARIITPVPSGIGPITVACLLENLVEINLIKNKKNI